METATLDTPTTEVQASSAVAPETNAPEATGQESAPASPAPSTQATPGASDPLGGVSPQVLIDHIARLESFIRSTGQVQPSAQSPAAQPQAQASDELDTLLAKAKEDGEFSEEGSKLVGALVSRLRSLEQATRAPSTPGANPGDPPLPSIEQVIQEARTIETVQNWYDAKAKEGFGEIYGADRSARQSSPMVQMQVKRHIGLASALQQASSQFGLSWDEGKCLDFAHGLLTQNLSVPQAVQTVKAQMAARNGQRMVPPSASAGGGGGGQGQAQSRADAVSAIRGIIARGT